jgi:predicted MPP superfamily phosphohydrolase
MKHTAVAVFFTVFFTVYGLVNYYIFVRGLQAIPAGSPLRLPYVVLFLFLALAFIGGRFLERVWLSPVSEGLTWIGSFWLAAMLYFFLAVILLDSFRLVNLFVPFFPQAINVAYEAVKFRIFLGSVTLVVLILAAGHLNTRYPRTRELDLHVAKSAEGTRTMTIVAASDIHLGTIIGQKSLRSIVDRINALAPDLILLPGDIVDEDLGPVIRDNLGETLRDLRARFGVYAVTGNHEYIGGAEAACRYLQDHGITMLRDSVARLPNGVTLVGREDASSRQFGGGQRRPLDEIMADVDVSSPVILMDHQPFRLGEAARNGVDLQLSGHTHHGQLWPFNYITDAVYELSWGFERKGSTNFYVSCGVGTWGPPVRTVGRPEIVHINVTFDASGAKRIP